MSAIMGPESAEPYVFNDREKKSLNQIIRIKHLTLRLWKDELECQEDGSSQVFVERVAKLTLWHVDNRIKKHKLVTKAKQSMSQYLQENFYITTSGNFRTQALTDVMEEVGSDRVLYVRRLPIRIHGRGKNWFENVAISETTA